MRAVNHSLIIGEWVQLLERDLATEYHAAAELKEGLGLVTGMGNAFTHCRGRATRSRVYLP